jgi:hypothetical protein
MSSVGRSVVTLESAQNPDLPSTPYFKALQAAFIEAQAAQCGYCTSGLLISATALLMNAHETVSEQQIREALEPHLCRCGAHNPRVAGCEKSRIAMWFEGASCRGVRMNQQPTPSVSLKTNPLLAQWLRFEVDGTVTVFTGKAELGQGILHALKLMAAHELAAPVSSIHIEAANTQHSPDEGMTSGSLSVQDSGMAIRHACAHAAQLFKIHACTSYAELRSKLDAQLSVDVTVPTKTSALTFDRRPRRPRSACERPTHLPPRHRN